MCGGAGRTCAGRPRTFAVRETPATRLAVVLDDDEDGAVEGVDEVVERVVRAGHGALGLVDGDFQEGPVRVGLEPGGPPGDRRVDGRRGRDAPRLRPAGGDRPAATSGRRSA